MNSNFVCCGLSSRSADLGARHAMTVQIATNNDAWLREQTSSRLPVRKVILKKY